jgi:glycosyltransferase involved in cell wall biosynthesis
VFGVATLAGLVPTLLQPTAHDEPPARLPIFRAQFHAVDGLLFLTEEERDVARRLFHVGDRGTVTGLGVDLNAGPGNGRAFRRAHGLGDDPYLIYVGRLDVFKGVSELMRYFVEYKGRNPSNLRLVLVGDRMMPIPDVDDIMCVGFLTEEQKRDALAGSVAMVQPSPYESFSIVVLEAWLQKKPVLVQAYSEVLRGQCVRSHGGLPYLGFAEFEACLDRLIADDELRDELGHNGDRYTRANYSWDVVIERFMSEVELATNRFAARSR